MPRPANTSSEAILDAVAALAGEYGPAAATIQAISAASGASVGSLYHRFSSRDALLAQAWLRTAAMFLAEFNAALDGAETVNDGLAAALLTPRWARKNRPAAALIVSRSRDEFLSAGASIDTVEQAQTLKRDLAASLNGFAERIGLADPVGLARCRYALVGIADGAVRLYLPERAPPLEVDAWVEAAYRGVMTAPS